tara:strand:- start:7 stop:858 length:852 start_codon:yes stop_codon:yes gene_type:complete
MKTFIISAHHNIPEYIELQYQCFNKFFQTEYEYIVINDAKNFAASTNFYQNDLYSKIKNMCDKYKIKCIDFPQNYHYDRTILFPHTREPNTVNSVTRCADVTQYAFNKFKNVNGYLMIIDSDMFLFEYFNIDKYMTINSSKINIAGIKQKMGYLWNGIVIFNLKTLPNIEDINFDCGKIDNASVDVGGHTYYYMKKYENIIKFKPITCGHYTYKSTFINENLNNKIKNILQEFTKLREDKSANKELILDNKIIHIRGGGNWEYKTLQFRLLQLDMIKKFIFPN